MKTNETPQLKTHGTVFLAKFNRALCHSFWTPEKDEMRFLFLLNILMYAAMPLWGKGLLKFMGPVPPLTIIAVGCVVYMIRFGRRLRNRGEMKFVLIASAAYLALIFGLVVVAARI